MGGVLYLSERRHHAPNAANNFALRQSSLGLHATSGTILGAFSCEGRSCAPKALGTTNAKRLRKGAAQSKSIERARAVMLLDMSCKMSWKMCCKISCKI
jgi:hypothetical protein